MAVAKEALAVQPLSLPEELILMLLNEQNGYFHQVPGWDMNCTVVGAALAELSLLSRIDTDMDSLHLVDRTETGDPALDPILKEIADEPVRRNAQYWIERLALRAESIIDLTLDRLVDLKILEHHDGDFWTLAPTHQFANLYGSLQEGTASQFIKVRINQVIFTDAIPDPRDAIIICLVNTCDVFRFMFELDDETEERIKFICQMDLIGRSIADAVEHNISSPLLRRSTLNKQVPRVSLRRLLLNPHLRTGNFPALFADLAKRVRPGIRGPSAVREAHALRCRTSDKPLGAPARTDVPESQGLFCRIREALWRIRRLALARRLRSFPASQGHVAVFFAQPAGKPTGPALQPCSQIHGELDGRRFLPRNSPVSSNGQRTNLASIPQRRFAGHRRRSDSLQGTGAQRPHRKDPAEIHARYPRHETQVEARRHAARTGPDRAYPRPAVRLPARPRRRLAEPARQRSRSLYRSRICVSALSAALVASVYLGDALSFAIYAMASQPELYARIRAEADALFENGDPDGQEFNPSSTDVTSRFITECLRMYPIVPLSMRDVMNSCVLEGYEMPVGSRLYIAQTAPHYMEDVFPDPFSFEIDRYLPPRDEHRGPGYAPYGLGTHRCLGARWMDLQLAVNVLMIAHYFILEVSPSSFKLRLNPFPSLKPSKKLKFRVAEQRRELNA